MNALSKEEVGGYLNEHFISTYQKVGTFRIANGQKKGGNVASYFCTPDGRVLHVVAGPVDGEVLIREARWVVENHKLAQLNGPGDITRLMTYFRKAHGERLHKEFGVETKRMTFPVTDPTTVLLASLFETHGPRNRGQEMVVRVQKLDRQGRVHYLLASYPLIKVGQIYEVIFEKVLGERISTLPVAVKG